jgi:hypothetical protein
MLRVHPVEVFEAELAPVWLVLFYEVPDLPLIHPRDQFRHVTRSVCVVEARPVMRRVILVVIVVVMLVLLRAVSLLAMRVTLLTSVMTVTATCLLTAAPAGLPHPVGPLPEPDPPPCVP